jgi:hypothetical protein
LLQSVSRSTSPFAVAAELAIDLVRAASAERKVEYNVCVSWSVNPSVSVVLAVIRGIRVA